MNKSTSRLAARRLPRSGGTATQAPTEPVGDPIQVRGKLALLGWPSLAAWSLAHGYDRNMGTYVVKTWGTRTDGRQPHGGYSRQLMRDLRETLATGKRPEDMPAPEAQEDKAA